MNSKWPPSQSPKTLLYWLPSQVTVQGPQNLTLLHPDRLMAPSCPPHSWFAFTISSASLFSSCPLNFLALFPGEEGGMTSDPKDIEAHQGFPNLFPGAPDSRTDS